ncbi:MAG: hypothetical protein ABSA30_07910 [Candidatus Aminicenantales bacterium]
MDKDNPLVQINPGDIAVVEQELAKSYRPFTLRELTEKLAFLKTASERTEVVKIYDQGSVYHVGDSIFKEYDELLTVSSKTHELFRGAVVLKVIKKRADKTLNCEMLEVDYTGGGAFRKYVDYMKKTKTDVLLPSNMGMAGTPPPAMGAGEDPRLTELPMQDRDLKALERSLRAAMGKSHLFFSWGDRWQLKAKQPEISEAKIKEIAASLAATRHSASTDDLVRSFFALEPSSDLFEIHCLWLDHILETKHKKEFVLVSPVAWGKWHLKSELNAMPEGLPLAAGEAALPEFDPAEKVDITPFHEFPLKVYLGWREIHSGGVKIPKTYNKELAHSREYVFTDADENKSYTVYYFPQNGYFLGLREFFAAANIPQGTSMTLEKGGPVQFNFWIKKSKKKIQVAKVAYDAAADTFADAGEGPTLAMPNKIIYIERDQMAKLVVLYPEREGKDLRELLIMVFKTFGVHSVASALHYLRAYHLVDVLKRTTQEDVELTLLNTPAFEKFDKKKGVFFYREAPIVVEPVVEEAPAVAARPVVVLTPEEMALAEAAAETAEPIDEVEAAEAGVILEDLGKTVLAALAPEKKPREEEKKPLAPPPAPPKKEKEKEKKKIKIDTDRRPKTRKSERRVLEEERLEVESARDALYAVKEAEDDILAELGADLPGLEPEEEAAAPVEAKPAPTPAKAKPKAEIKIEAEEASEPAEDAVVEEEAEAAPAGGAPAAGGTFGGIFANKLKAALKKKREEGPAEDEGEGGEPPADEHDEK